MDSAQIVDHFVQESYHAGELSSTVLICFWPKVMNSSVVTRLNTFTGSVCDDVTGGLLKC